jgi:phosphatidylglycerol lysyltransferase
MNNKNLIKDLKKYGNSSLSYLSLAKDLSIFSKDNWNGYFAYKEFFNSITILGDPITPKKSFLEAINDLVDDFSTKNKHLTFFLCTDEIVEILEKKGFKVFYFGKEAIIDLDKFDISGKKGWSIRSSVNYAKRNNMVVEEYEYNKNRDMNLENEILKISNEWCQSKKEPELNFAFGHVNFNDYDNVRYFICKNKGKVVGFINLYPIFGINSFYLDLTRKGVNSPRGTIDFLYYESIKKLKKEGIKKIHIGLSPLSFLSVYSKNRNQKYLKLMSLFYPFLSLIYPFKSEFFYKNKFATNWKSNYICFYPKVSIRSLFSLLHSIYQGGFAGIFIYKIKKSISIKSNKQLNSTSKSFK